MPEKTDKDISEISRLKASILMNASLDKAKSCIMEEGYFFPMMLLFNKKRMKVSYDHPSVLRVKNISPPIEGLFKNVYSTYVMLRSKTLEDEKNRQKIAHDIVQLNKPDVFGLIEPILYRVCARKLDLDLSVDPEATKVLHSIFYVKGEPSARIYNTVYIDRGVKKLDPFSDKKGRDIYFIESGWAKRTKLLYPRIENPYK